MLRTMMIPSVTNPVSYLRAELEGQKALFDAQPVIVQRFLEAQAQRLAEASLAHPSQVRFMLPDRVIDRTPQNGEKAPMLIPTQMREQVVGGWKGLFQNDNHREHLRQRLNQLEQSSDQAIHTGAALLRYATVIHMVHRMLPAGRSVTYHAEQDELIPSIPLDDGAKGSAISLTTDAVSGEENPDEERGALQVPYSPAARRFYLPQWVALDDENRLLVNSVAEAETFLASMQRYLTILHKAVALATYITADEAYQRKRYGMLGQLVHQGRALARYKTAEMIKTVKERAQAGKLNRGLSLSLPYFNDQELQMDMLKFSVIPGGRIMFKPVFVRRAVHLEQAKVAQDTRLSASTRKYLLFSLKMLEEAF